MTDQKQEKRALIEYKAIKPLIDALALAGGCSSAVLISMIDNPIGKAAAVGFGFSCFWYWGRSNLTATGPKRKKPQRRDDYLTVNSAKGSRQVRRFEQVAPSHIIRQSLWADMLDLVRKSEPHITNQPPVSPRRPQTLDQFAFVSYDNAGNRVQLLSCDVRNFLRRAWLYRPRGKGLGARFWGNRNQRTWPEWYPGPFWYEALVLLIRQTEKGLGRQLIVPLGYQQEGLRWGSRETYEHLIYWYTK